MLLRKIGRVAVLTVLLPMLLPAGPLRGTRPTLFAQSGSSSISGVVKDATGGALPGASVKVVNEDTGVSLETVTNEEGLYRVPALVPGSYRVETSLTFFFGTWERTRQLTSDTVISTVPTLRNREGDFSDLQNSGGQPTTIHDPQTRQPFTGNVIPRDRLDPVALAALRYFPLPNRAGTQTNANNYVGTSESSLDRDILLGRIDHRLTSDDVLTVRYYINNSGTRVSL